MIEKRRLIIALAVFFILNFSACKTVPRTGRSSEAVPENPVFKPLPPNSSPQLKQLIEGAVAQAGVTTGYDPAYVRLNYPNGDVPIKTGVCSDVVVRAFREVGIDLQKELHEDMTRAFDAYPKRWGLSGPDRNIDHRRVPNLMTYFSRQGKAVPITNEPNDYLPGDVVAWDLGGGTLHIGLVTSMLSESERECLIVHNIGAGTRVEDVLMNWTIIGHYRFFK